MPRRTFNQEAFHLDQLRSTPSQQHLEPTSRSSTSSQQDLDELERDMGGSANVGPANAASGRQLEGALGPQRPHKLDLYSIPVFLLECLLLGALSYAAYLVHFQWKLQPMLSGFYCDDISLRHRFRESAFTKQFRRPDNELQVLALLLLAPLVFIIFCELVNSMFGSLKFRQIRSLCKCCKLHSITRRTLRFSSAYLLGFMIVLVSSDILAASSGSLRPYFAQECPLIYNECAPGQSGGAQQQPPARDATGRDFSLASTLESIADGPADKSRPPSAPISVASGSSEPAAAAEMSSGAPSGESIESRVLGRSKRQASPAGAALDGGLLERKWIDLSDANLIELCQFSGDAVQARKFDSLAKSWPSQPAAVFSYACFYLVAYLSFVATARPVRLLTSILVMLLLLGDTIFSVQLVKEHYQHWADVAGAACLSAVVVLFVLLVYLNKFRDSHYYENQKLYGSASRRQQQLRRMLDSSQNFSFGPGVANEALNYHLDKIEGGQGAHVSGGASAPLAHSMQNGTEPNGGSSPNNDLAMRYFQIPRANYRGAPRPGRI